MTIDIAALRAAYEESPIIEGLFEVLGDFVNNRTVTKVDRALKQLPSHGIAASRQDLVSALRTLEELGLGRFIKGTHGHPSRMEWDVKTRHLRDWVLDEHASEEEIHDGLEGEDIAPEGDWIVHTLVLRHDMTVELELPADLSINEATRLGWLLSSAAFDDEHFAPDEMIERTHYIRPNLPISIDLPADLTEEEAHRLQTFAEILLHKGENHT